MKALRVLAVVVLIGAVAALVAWFPGRSEEREVAVGRASVPAAIADSGSSWFCAGRDAGAPLGYHAVLLTAVGERPARVTLSAYSDKARTAQRTITVRAGATEVVDVGADLGSAGQSVMVEADAPVVVEHRLATSDGADQAPCAVFSARRWFFPQVVTTRDSKALLTLFNPFPADAAVDITVAFDTGVRTPTALSGIVVPAGTSQVVDLGATVQRRDQFAATVTTRSGGVVAELVNRFDGTGSPAVSGLRLVSGVRSPAARWSLAGGFTNPTSAERLVIQNPGRTATTAVVQVSPYGATASLPEPFEIKVPALRYAVVDLDKESRVPPQGYHAIDVETRDGTPVVVARSETVTGAPPPEDTAALRAAVTKGTSAARAAPVAARQWVSTGMHRDEGADGAVLVHNPGRGATGVEVSAISPEGDQGTTVRTEVPAGDSVVVSAEQLGITGARWAAQVTADRPVVVERLFVFPGVGDFSLQPSVPVVGRVTELTVLGR